MSCEMKVLWHTKLRCQPVHICALNKGNCRYFPRYNMIRNVSRQRLNGMASMSMRCTRTQWQCQTTTAFVIATYLLFIQIAFVAQSSATTIGELSCLKLKTPGATFPSGDINIEYGDPLEIFCILDPNRTERNASSLIFETNNKKVPDEHVEIINSTTIRLFIEKPIPSNSMYYCKLREEPEKNLGPETVCLNDVAVGFKPQEVKNFSCISLNWENLTCTWDPPLNFLKTTTKLEYYLPGRAGGRFSYPCPERMEKHENKCFWDRSTSVVYRQPYENYYFKMTISNPLGNITQKFKFHHYAYVIPSKPVNSTVLNKTSNSVYIQWSVGFPMQSFPPGVLQRVEYQSEWDSRDTWHSVDVKHLNPKNKTHTLNITGLKYAHSFYDIRIYMKSPQANGDDKWSKPASLTVKTLPDVPGAPPKTDVGSFEISRGLPSRDIYVYWQRIPDYLNNGDNFEYQVFDVNENGVETLFKPDESEKAYARFKSLMFKDYHFRIYSVNEKGRSKNGSDIRIPAVQDIVSEPLTFTKIAFENGIYELSWKKPVDHLAKIESYTIFWCDNKKDRPFQCNGLLNWTHVGKDTVIKNITVPEDKVYQFAVSANSLNSSSGMVWASCTVIHNKVIGKMKSVWINSVGSTYIELGWKLECSDRVGVVKGFRIYFCPLASPRAKDCKGGDKSNMTIMGDPLTGHVNVTSLIPYTTYMLSVAVITKSGEGLQSDVLFNTTLEDAPEPPRNVRISNLTNTSMVVDWDPPLNMNGVLRSYSVRLSSSEGTDTKETMDLKMMLTNLQSYTLYNISVSARTTLSSAYVSAPTVRTRVGIPGVVEQPIISPISSVNNLNKSQMVINWTPPNNPRGKIDYYEVMLTQLNENANESDVQQVYGNKIVVNMECEGVENLGRSMRYMIYVRAVNVRVDEDKNITLFGPWSSPGLRSCYNAGFPGYLQFCIILFVMMAVVSILFGCAYFVNRCYRCCQDCRSVGAKLPTPFNTQNLEKDAETHKRMHGFPTDVMKIDPDCNVTDCIYRNHPAPDQELLLFKKAENECDGDGDSSGCSSAHESVSSSLTSGTHISDSGTEDQPESPTLLPVLRQRITSSSSRDVRSVPDQYVMIGSSENSLNTGELEPSYSRFVPKGGTGYCVVGNAPQDYLRVSMPSNPQVPSVMTSGYVSHPPPRSDSKISVPSVTPGSKGYVMAGSLPVVESQTEKKPSTSYCRLGITGDFIMLPSTSKNPSDS